MKIVTLCLISILPWSFSSAASAEKKDPIHQAYSQKRSEVEDFYRDLHRHPELSGKEVKTAKKLSQKLQDLGFKVTENIGGTGIVGLYKNGEGPTLWLRTDLDGLPIEEETGKKYASQIKGVMHGCGHDVHMAAMVGYAHVLKTLSDHWQGTLVLIGQPAEEIGAGAKAMIDDGLYKRFPKPDFVLAFHVSGNYPKGHIRYTEGFALAAVDSIDIRVRGEGGHGAAPHVTVDPVMLAAKMVVNLQTLVSRNINPIDPVVLTFGSIHGGTKHNIIPNEVHLQGTLRTYSEESRELMKKGIPRMAKSLAQAEGAPAPSITFSQSLPPVYNEPKLMKRLVPIFNKAIGKKNVSDMPGIMGAEDFAHYRQNGKYSTALFWVGGAPENQKNFGSNHSSKFAPTYKESIAVAVRTMSEIVFDLAPNKKSK